MTAGELRAVSVGVGTLLDDVNLTAPTGRLLAITGPSGSGKTTLAHVLAGALRPDRGEVLLGGTPLEQLGPGARPSFVPQDYGLVATLTAAETVALPLQARGLAKAEIRERASGWIEATGLESCATRPVSDLSGGQRQRVAIARALAMDAPALVMDEPTSELDADNRDLVLSLLGREAENGRILVVVSHDPDVLARSDDHLALGHETPLPATTS
jgi:putative ABC transport system ATP-binding protein